MHDSPRKKKKRGSTAPSGITVIHHHDCACVRAFKACLCNYISGSISPSQAPSCDCFIKAKTSLFLTTQSVIAAPRRSRAAPLPRSHTSPHPPSSAGAEAGLGSRRSRPSPGTHHIWGLSEARGRAMGVKGQLSGFGPRSRRWGSESDLSVLSRPWP